MERHEFLDRLLLVAPFLLMGSAARLGDLFFRKSPPPPRDSEARRDWRRAQLWLLLSELSALPAFLGLAIVVPRHYGLNADYAAGLAMVLGAFGYPATIAIAKRLIDARLIGGRDDY